MHRSPKTEFILSQRRHKIVSSLVSTMLRTFVYRTHGVSTVANTLVTHTTLVVLLVTDTSVQKGTGTVTRLLLPSVWLVRSTACHGT